MQDKTQIYFWSLIVVSAIVLVVFQVNSRPKVNFHGGENQANVANQEVMTVYSKNCARCHGAFGQGFASNPGLQGRKIPVEMVRSLIQNGKGKMPSFPEIKEPQLSKLAEYISVF